LIDYSTISSKKAIDYLQTKAFVQIISVSFGLLQLNIDPFGFNTFVLEYNSKSDFYGLRLCYGCKNEPKSIHRLRVGLETPRPSVFEKEKNYENKNLEHYYFSFNNARIPVGPYAAIL